VRKKWSVFIQSLNAVFSRGFDCIYEYCCSIEYANGQTTTPRVKRKGLTKKDCYPVIQKETGFDQSTVLRDWFDNQDKLSPVDYTSRQFWKVDVDYEKVTNPMNCLKIEDSTIGVDVSSSEHDSSEDGSDDESTQVNQSYEMIPTLKFIANKSIDNNMGLPTIPIDTLELEFEI
jgi:hypothetical protein